MDASVQEVVDAAQKWANRSKETMIVRYTPEGYGRRTIPDFFPKSVDNIPYKSTPHIVIRPEVRSNPPWRLEHQKNPYIMLTEPWSGIEVPIDERLAPLVQHLWDKNVPTSYSDQGLNRGGYLVVRWPYDYAKPILDKLAERHDFKYDSTGGIELWKGGDRVFPENSITIRWKKGVTPLKAMYEAFNLDYPNSREKALAMLEERDWIQNPRTPGGKKVPTRYLKGLTKLERMIAEDEIDKGYEYDADDPEAYEFWKSDIKAKARGLKIGSSKHKEEYYRRYRENIDEDYKPSGSTSKQKFLNRIRKETGIKKSILEKTYDKGLAAWRTGHRPGVQQHQWAAGRVYALAVGADSSTGPGKPDHSLAVEAGVR